MKLRTAIPLLFGAACLGAAGLVAVAVATMPDSANPATSTPTTTAVTTPPTTVLIPATINATCTADVSGKLQHWLANLPAHTTVDATGCYEVDQGLKLQDRQFLTISGGTWKDTTSPKKGAPAKDSPPAILWFVGGQQITVTGVTIQGPHTGAYVYSGAFQAGIRSDGVQSLDIQHDVITGPGGDGIELAPLRGAQDDSGQIVAPTRNAWIQYDTITEAGRQGVTLAGVNGAYLSSITLDQIGINDFDLEADQTDEGAKNVTIDGCQTGSSGAGFFANGGAGGSADTGRVIVENCTMTVKNGGDPILVQNIAGQTTNRGPFLFEADTIRCGASVYVGCIQLDNANVAIENSKLVFPAGTVHEDEYKVAKGSTLTLSGLRIQGPFQPGTVDKTSRVGS